MTPAPRNQRSKGQKQKAGRSYPQPVFIKTNNKDWLSSWSHCYRFRRIRKPSRPTNTSKAREGSGTTTRIPCEAKALVSKW